MDLTWDASADAVSYNIYRGTVSGGPYTHDQHLVRQRHYLRRQHGRLRQHLLLRGHGREFQFGGKRILKPSHGRDPDSVTPGSVWSYGGPGVS